MKNEILSFMAEYCTRGEPKGQYFPLQFMKIGIPDVSAKLPGEFFDFYILVKYNFPDYPIYSGAACLGDGNTSCVRQAFGGEYADYGTVFSQKYIDSLEDKNYLSPDLKINAATCLFPETTWFIKNMHHETFPYPINRLALDVMNNEAVVSDGRYPAVQEYVADGNKLIPVETTDEDAEKEKKNFFTLVIDFFKSLIEVMKKLFNGEIAL